MPTYGVRWPRRGLGAKVLIHAHHDNDDGGPLDMESIPDDALGTGTPDDSTFLNGDREWVVPVLGMDSIPDDALGDGTPDDTMFLRGDRVWAVPDGGAGGGGGSYLDSPPGSPSAYDDQFVDASLNAKWSALLTPAAGSVVTPNKRGKWLSFVSPGHASDNQQQFRQTFAGSDGDAGTAFSVLVEMSVTSLYGAGTIHPSASCILHNGSDPASGSRLQLVLGSNGNNYRVAVYDDGSQDFGFDIGLVSTVWFYLRRTTGNVTTAWVSVGGTGWRRVWSETKTYDFNYVTLRGIGSPSGSTPSEMMWANFRINDNRADAQ